MTVGFLSIGSVVGPRLWDDSFSGFDRPASAQVVGVLSDGTSAAAWVLQQGAWSARRAKAGFSCSRADSLTIRGYYEAGTTVTFTDVEGASTSVVVLEFDRSLKYPDVWACSVTLLEAA